MKKQQKRAKEVGIPHDKMYRYASDALDTLFRLAKRRGPVGEKARDQLWKFAEGMGVDLGVMVGVQREEIAVIEIIEKDRD